MTTSRYALSLGCLILAVLLFSPSSIASPRGGYGAGDTTIIHIYHYPAPSPSSRRGPPPQARDFSRHDSCYRGRDCRPSRQNSYRPQRPSTQYFIYEAPRPGSRSSVDINMRYRSTY